MAQKVHVNSNRFFLSRLFEELGMIPFFRMEGVMKLVTKGLVNKILEVDDEPAKLPTESVDNMNLAFQTTTHPYHGCGKIANTPFNDPTLFIIYFQRIL